MSQRVPVDALDGYLIDMLCAGRAGAHHSALALALVIPDICGSIEYPTKPKVGNRYRDWCDEWGKMVSISGADCYALRCAYLHSGQDEFSGPSEAHALFARVGFTIGEADGGWVSRALPPSMPGGKQSARIPVETFCRDMATSADAWRRSRQCDPRVVEEIARLMWMRPAA
jgi:hypothetical protein